MAVNALLCILGCACGAQGPFIPLALLEERVELSGFNVHSEGLTNSASVPPLPPVLGPQGAFCGGEGERGWEVVRECGREVLGTCCLCLFLTDRCYIFYRYILLLSCRDLYILNMSL